MKRKAVIIAAPLIPDQNSFLPGVEMDVVNYTSFLTSPVGGSWLQSEIQVLWNPSSSEVTKVMQATRSNYVFSVFTGHGGTDSISGKSYVKINTSKSVYLI